MFLSVMRYIKFMAAPQKVCLMEEGDEGDRFYVIIQGNVSVLKSFTVEVPNFDVKMLSSEKVSAWLQVLFDNRANANWSKVPYKVTI